MSRWMRPSTLSAQGCVVYTIGYSTRTLCCLLSSLAHRSGFLYMQLKSAVTSFGICTAGFSLQTIKELHNILAIKWDVAPT